MKQKKSIDMLHGTLWDKILLVAVPLACTAALQQLFNAADIAVLGRAVGKTAMAAVGSNAPVVGLGVNLLNGLSLGANVVISGYIGSGGRERAQQAVHIAVLVAISCGLFLTFLGEIAAVPLLGLLKVPDTVLPMALLYVRVYLLGMPIFALYNFEAAVFRSIGDTRTPLYCLAMSGVVNVCLNLFFVLCLGRTVDGVAIATVVSNLICAGLLFFLLCRSKEAVRICWKEFTMDAAILRRMLQIGIPTACQLMVVSLANIFVQSGVNRLGEDAMAGGSAASNIEIFGFYIITAFGQACTTFVGQNYGAGDLERSRRAVRVCLLEEAIATALVVTNILLFCTPLIRIFNQDPAVVALGRTRTFFIVSSWGFSVFIEVLSGAMRGYRCSFVPAMMAILGTCGVRVVWIATVFRSIGTFASLYAVYPVSLGITSVAVIISYLFIQKRLSALWRADRISPVT